MAVKDACKKGMGGQRPREACPGLSCIESARCLSSRLRHMDGGWRLSCNPGAVCPESTESTATQCALKACYTSVRTHSPRAQQVYEIITETFSERGCCSPVEGDSRAAEHLSAGSSRSASPRLSSSKSVTPFCLARSLSACSAGSCLGVAVKAVTQFQSRPYPQGWYIEQLSPAFSAGMFVHPALALLPFLCCHHKFGGALVRY
jgi:hypothetical protein